MKEVCMICRDRNKPDAKKRRLDMIENLLRREEAAEGNWFLNWGIRFRCSFGLGCPSLDVARIEMESKARNLTPQMRHFALHGSDAKFHEMLRLLQGEFPAVYQQMEIWRAERRRACAE